MAALCFLFRCHFNAKNTIAAANPTSTITPSVIPAFDPPLIDEPEELGYARSLAEGDADVEDFVEELLLPFDDVITPGAVTTAVDVAGSIAEVAILVVDSTVEGPAAEEETADADERADTDDGVEDVGGAELGVEGVEGFADVVGAEVVGTGAGVDGDATEVVVAGGGGAADDVVGGSGVEVGGSGVLLVAGSGVDAVVGRGVLLETACLL